MRVSIIISFRQSDEDRGTNLRGVLNYLSRFLSDTIEIIVVEQDAESKLGWLSEMDKRIKHLLIKNPGVFNKGWGYNVGAKFSEGECLIFHDADLYIREESYLGGLSWLDKYDVVDPYDIIFYLLRPNSHVFVAEGYDMGCVYTPGFADNRVKAIVISGGIFTIKREAFFALKGFDETCVGFGYEDNIFDEKMRKMGLKIKSISDWCIHVYHKSVREGFDKRDPYFNYFIHNKQIFQSYERMTREQVAARIEAVKTWGEADYENITH